MATNLIDATGIGMRNTDKRLQLIYPNKHTVATQENEAQYTVNLSIELI